LHSKRSTWNVGNYTLCIMNYTSPKGFYVCPRLVPFREGGITLYPFVFVTHEKYLHDPYLINHERIHLAQQRELLVLPFYIWYLLALLINYCKYRNWYTAYRYILFEREAYNNDSNLNYLKTRKWYAYLRKRK